MRSDRRAERAGAESGAAPEPGEPWVWIDGRIGPASEARISTLDHAFLYGDSVFETLRTYGGRPFRLEAHLDRLERSAARIALDLPLDRSALRQIV
ncbi:MAG: aminotransferase class IV, partial [Planctomycetota bacterium]